MILGVIWSFWCFMGILTSFYFGCFRGFNIILGGILVVLEVLILF